MRNAGDAGQGSGVGQVFLLPGELHASAEPCRITTVLGSCVGVALWDPVTRAGGLNHYLLAAAPAGVDRRSLRFGELAIPTLIEELERLGADRRRLVARVFGGANTLKGVDIGAEVGRANIELAERLLGELRIPILERDVGGLSGRRIVLDTWSFEVTQTHHHGSGGTRARGKGTKAA